MTLNIPKRFDSHSSQPTLCIKLLLNGTPLQLKFSMQCVILYVGYCIIRSLPHNQKWTIPLLFAQSTRKQQCTDFAHHKDAACELFHLVNF